MYLNHIHFPPKLIQGPYATLMNLYVVLFSYTHRVLFVSVKYSWLPGLSPFSKNESPFF